MKIQQASTPFQELTKVVQQSNYGDVDSFSMEGIALGYATDSLSFNLSLDQSVEDNLKNENEGLNYELAVSYTGIDNLVANIGYRVNQEGDNSLQILNLLILM